MELKTESHRAEVRDDGCLIVWNNQKATIRETRIGPEGVESRFISESDDPSMRNLLAALSRMPYFAAAYGGNDEWHCDIDAGFQRCRKTESEVTINEALHQCGFDGKDISLILKECQKSEHSFVPWRA